MVPSAETRVVNCYLCGKGLEVSREALSITCPGCHRNITIEDVVLKKNRPKLLMVSSVQTCGRIVVPKRTRLVAEVVDAHGGIEVHGHLEARTVRCRGPVVLAKKAYWRGDLTAPALSVADKAVIDPSRFRISPAVLNPRRKKKRVVRKKAPPSSE